MEKTIEVAADIGNGFSKVAIDGQRMELQPSLIAHITEPLSNQQQSQDEIFQRLNEQLDITVQSDLTLNGRYLIGKAAQNKHFGQMSFNINSNADKAHSDITVIMTLGMIVLNELQGLSKRKKLPTTIQLKVKNMTTALPIIEAANSKHCNELKERYIKQTHIITVNNFQNPIVFQITFDNVLVTSEGVIGNLGLIFEPQTMTYRKESYFKGLENRSKQNSKFSGKSILALGNIIGIDIGDGTIDISAIGKDLNPLIGENQFIDGGIGNAIDDAMQQLRQGGTALNSRQVFLKQALENNERGAYYRELLNQQLPVIESQIIEKVKTIYTDLNNDIALIYFHGAGANIIKEDFQNKLMNLLDQIDQFHLTNVLWLQDKDSQWLNLDGLEIQLKQLN